MTKQSALSGKIEGPVFEKITEFKPQLMSTDCAGCQIQITRHTGLSEKELAHPVQIVAEAYRSHIKPLLSKNRIHKELD
jgi:Fe-S oxidoreductase